MMIVLVMNRKDGLKAVMAAAAKLNQHAGSRAVQYDKLPTPRSSHHTVTSAYMQRQDCALIWKIILAEVQVDIPAVVAIILAPHKVWIGHQTLD